MQPSFDADEKRALKVRAAWVRQAQALACVTIAHKPSVATAATTAATTDMPAPPDASHSPLDGTGAGRTHTAVPRVAQMGAGGQEVFACQKGLREGSPMLVS